MEGRPRNARSARRAVARPRDGRQFHAMTFCVGDQVWPQFIQCDGHQQIRVSSRTIVAVRCGRVASKHSAKYGLQGICVCEASHPGLVSRATSRSTQMDSDSDALLVNSGRFMVLSRDSDGSDEDVGAEPASHQSGKRLRVTRRDRTRTYPGNTFTRDPSSGALEFDLTQLDSELEGPLPPAEALDQEHEGRAQEKTGFAVCPR